MPRIITIFILLINLSAFCQPYRTVANTAFVRGEKLTFRVAYYSSLTGSIPAGKATLEVKDETKIINNRSTYHVVAEGKTSGLIEVFYKLVDRYESYFDEEAFIPWQYSRYTRENTYKKDDLVTFRHNDQLAVSLKKILKVPVNIQDPVSAFYYARTLDISQLEIGGIIDIPYYLDDSVYRVPVIYKGRETVKTKLGKISCFVFRPGVAKGYAFNDPYPATLWISDDANRLPVLIESELSVGHARVELISYSGLANPFTSILQKE
jgi:hypothetical protein